MKKLILLFTCFIAGLCSQAQNCSLILASDKGITLNSSTTNLCPGQVAILTSNTVHPSVAGQNLDFIWYLGNTDGPVVKSTINNLSATTTATAFSDLYPVSATAPGLYTLLVRDHDNPTAQACWYTASVVITATPAPSYVITGGGSYCSNTSGASSAVSINLSGTAPFSLTWTDGNSITTKTGITSSPYVITPTGSGTYTVSAISDAYCVGVPTTNSAIVTKIQQPDVTWDVTKDSIYCAYANTTMLGVRINSPATATNGYSYKWMNVTNNIDMGNASSASLQAPTGTKVYGLTVSDVVNGTACVQALRNRVITQNALPTYTVTGGGTFCSGATITPVTVTIGGGIQPYSLSYKDGAGVSHTSTVTGYNPISFALPERVAGTYQVISINDASPDACGAPIDPSKTATIAINPSPTITAVSSWGISAMCVGAVPQVATSSLFTFSPAGGSAVYTCSKAPAINGSNFVFTNIPGTYTVSATYNANGCASVATNTITVYGLPTITASASPSVICNGFSSAVSATGAAYYAWNNGLGSGFSSSKTVSPTVTTSYFVTGTDVNSCTNTASTTVTVNPLPIVTPIVTTPICSGSIVSGNVSLSSLFTFTNGSTVSYLCSNPNAISMWTFTYANVSGTYTITATATIGTCSGNGINQIVVNPLPTITASAIPTVINVGSTSIISVSGAYSYKWNNSITSVAQTVTPTNSTTYSVTGTDANGCVNTANTIVTVNQAPTVTATAPTGSGTNTSPYQIATINNLYWLSQNSSAWGSTFIQTADIDASSLASSVGFSPIGTYSNTMFTGKYDGQNHVINYLTINRNATTCIGLFGCIRNATISNLGLTNVAITGLDYTGALVGYCYSHDTIVNCYSTGTLSSSPNSARVGGLIGAIEYSKVTNSYSACTVTGGGNTGGLIGSIVYDQGNTTSISNCYASGAVTGNNIVGGFIGNVSNAPTITNCYAIGTVTGTNSVGGFAGSVSGGFGPLIISNCYSSGNIVCSGTSKGGFVASVLGTITNCFWNTETSGMSVGFGTNTGTITSLTGVTSAQMKTQSTFTNVGWDYKYETANGTANNWAQYDYVNSGYPTLTWQINYWNGTGNWNTASNWTPAYMPRANANIIIETGELTYNQNYTIENACINPGANLTINSGLGFYTNNLLLVKSDVTGTGSIIGYGKCNGNSIKVEQYLGGGRNWYIASPLEAAKSYVIKTPLTNKLWNYNEPTANWNEITDATTTLSAMTGYVALVPHDTVITYGGGVGSSLNLFYNSISLIRTGTNSQSGFNLIGNPYLSCVNWEWATKTNLEPSIWYRTKNTNNAYVFDSYNASSHVGTNNNGKGAVTQFISPLQAVWVQVSPTAGTGQLSFDNSMLSHPVVGNVLKADIEISNIRLTVSNGKNSDETILVFNEQAGNGYDGFDSEKMFNTNNDMPELYTLADNEKLVINGMKPIDSSKVIPLGFKTLKLGTFTISATEINGVDGVVLDDKLLNKTQDLTGSASYTFTSDNVDNASRFAIRLKANSVTDAPTVLKSIITIAAQNKSIVVTTSETTGTVNVYDLLGRIVETKAIAGTKTIVESPNGVYFVKVQTAKNVETKKLIIE